jgi:hypothetical protein
MGVWQLLGWAAVAAVTVLRIALVVAVIAATTGIVRAVVRAKPTAPNALN